MDKKRGRGGYDKVFVWSWMIEMGGWERKERKTIVCACACGEGGASEWAREKEEKERKRAREWEDERKSRGKRKKPAIEKKNYCPYTYESILLPFIPLILFPRNSLLSLHILYLPILLTYTSYL